MPSEQKNYRIIQLKAENVKRIKAVTIKPKGDVVTISGANGEGKTSVLDCIWLAFDGSEAAKKNPDVIRKGEEKASITIDLGDITISKRFTQKDTYLDVFTKDGAKYPSPQALLNKLITMISFDPLQFSNMEPKKQFDLLMKFSKISIDLPEHDRKIKEAMEDRALTGRELERAKGAFESTPVPADLTVQEIKPVTELVQERSKLIDDQTEKQNKVETIEGVINEAKEDIERAEAKIHELESQLEVQRAVVRDRTTTIEVETPKLAKARKAVAGGKHTTAVAEIDRQIAEGDKIRINNDAIKRYTDAKIAFEAVKELHVTKEKVVNALRAKRESAIAEAKFPIKGLGINEENLITFDGVPYSQASSAERIRIGIAMIVAMNPQLRVIRIVDGSLLDKESKQAVIEMAKKHDLQVWLEVVDETGKLGVVIEDGEVKADNE